LPVLLCPVAFLGQLDQPYKQHPLHPDHGGVSHTADHINRPALFDDLAQIKPIIGGVHRRQLSHFQQVPMKSGRALLKITQLA